MPAPNPSELPQTLTVHDDRVLHRLVGPFGAHLTLVAQAFGVPVQQRGSVIEVGPGEGVPGALHALSELGTLIQQGSTLSTADVAALLSMLQKNPHADVASWHEQAIVMRPSGRTIVPKTAMQHHYLQVLRSHTVVFAVGPAGTGKTYLAMAMALMALHRGEVRRIVLSRPAVEAGEKLGFLPGDLHEKVHPYYRPLLDAMHDLVGMAPIAKWLEQGVIEIAPLAYMRGRTFTESYLVLDEAQNTTSAQMRLFLTRLGEGSRVVVTGDSTQSDLPATETSGLAEALLVLQGIDQVSTVQFRSTDVVRHPLVTEFIDAYAAAASRRACATLRGKS